MGNLLRPGRLRATQHVEAIEEPLYPYGSVGFFLGPDAGARSNRGSVASHAFAGGVPLIAVPNATNGEPLYGLQPGLNLPWSQEFNVALQQALGNNQSFTHPCWRPGQPA